MKTHKDLDSWKKSIELVTDIYRLTNNFPKTEQYGLTSQIRRSAVSVPSNIAEGAGRQYDKEFIQFLHISLGSLSELETQLIISINLEYLSSHESNHLFEKMKDIRNLINGLIRHLRK